MAAFGRPFLLGKISVNDFEAVRVVVELLVTALASVLFWNFKGMQAEHKKEVELRGALDKDLQAYKLHVAEHYATSSDMKALIEAVFKKLDRIEEKLDGKADKP